MNAPSVIEVIFQDAFEDVALLIGGAAALRHFEDDLVWNLLRGLDRVRLRAISRLSRSSDHVLRGAGRDGPHPAHPAVEEFLLRNRVGMHPAPTAGSKRDANRKEPKPCDA